eukprot:CAMPEP_0170276262 /NCGR_PEP_ID=MMETSP0116_2-20130129/38116_1 /TAXON_ID=400756 /ORGANISM="Durinskia baltica, Strain CSIRO CS-38" /LENGTH=333 /DNA_ID=CAMNT_0010527535 /DNA_START=70 /DNA_END=1073 /DNA_ORIENTATION=-
MASAFACDQAAQITTLLVRGIPRKYSAWDVVRELDAIMDPEAYDFVYVARKRNAPSNMGFAFLNFVSPASAQAAFNLMSGQQWKSSGSLKVSAADVQGLASNLRRFRNAVGYLQGRDIAQAPLVFKDGEQVPIDVALGRCGLGDAAAAATPPRHRPAKRFQAEPMAGMEIFEDCDDLLDVSSIYSETRAPSSPRSSGASSAGDIKDAVELPGAALGAQLWSLGATSAAPPGLSSCWGLPPPARLPAAPRAVRESGRRACPEPPLVVIQRFSFDVAASALMSAAPAWMPDAQSCEQALAHTGLHTAREALRHASRGQVPRRGIGYIFGHVPPAN